MQKKKWYIYMKTYQSEDSIHHCKSSNNIVVASLLCTIIMKNDMSDTLIKISFIWPIA